MNALRFDLEFLNFSGTQEVLGYSITEHFCAEAARRPRRGPEAGRPREAWGDLGYVLIS